MKSPLKRCTLPILPLSMSFFTLWSDTSRLRSHVWSYGGFALPTNLTLKHCLKGIYKLNLVAHSVSKHLHHQKDVMNLQMTCLYCKARELDRLIHMLLCMHCWNADSTWAVPTQKFCQDIWQSVIMGALTRSCVQATCAMRVAVYVCVAGKNQVQRPAEKKSPVCSALAIISLVIDAFTCTYKPSSMPLKRQY